MVAWSSIALRNIARFNLSRRTFVCLKYEPNAGHKIKNAVSFSLTPICRDHGPKTMQIMPSRYNWEKFKDMANFYFLLGTLPLLLLITYVNIFIGPATLAVIPEGYEPKPWEYHEHPISRFFAKYLTMSPQESHERNLHNIFYHNERMMIKALENKIEGLIRERQDYQAYFMDPLPSKYVKLTEEFGKEADEFRVQTHGWVN